MLKYSLDRYKTQEIRDKFCLLALKFAPNWFLKNKMLKQIDFFYSLTMTYHVRLMAWFIKYKQRKTCKMEKSQELMHATSHSTTGTGACQDMRKRNKIIFD